MTNSPKSAHVSSESKTCCGQSLPLPPKETFEMVHSALVCPWRNQSKETAGKWSIPDPREGTGANRITPRRSEAQLTNVGESSRTPPRRRGYGLPWIWADRTVIEIPNQWPTVVILDARVLSTWSSEDSIDRLDLRIWKQVPIPSSLLIRLVANPLINKSLVDSLRRTVADKAVPEYMPTSDRFPIRTGQYAVKKVGCLEWLDFQFLAVWLLHVQTSMVLGKRESTGWLRCEPIFENCSETV
jgi:hypothetical protein